jgi:hypothetical protein
MRAKNFCEMFPKRYFLHLKNLSVLTKGITKVEGMRKSTDLKFADEYRLVFAV